MKKFITFNHYILIMSLEGAVQIKFYADERNFEIESGLTKEGQFSIIENFLRRQAGAGEDNSESNKKEVYIITLKWNPSNDNISAYDNTGNKGLRDGILSYVLSNFY